MLASLLQGQPLYQVQPSCLGESNGESYGGFVILAVCTNIQVGHRGGGGAGEGAPTSISSLESHVQQSPQGRRGLGPSLSALLSVGPPLSLNCSDSPPAPLLSAPFTEEGSCGVSPFSSLLKINQSTCLRKEMYYLPLLGCCQDRRHRAPILPAI